MDTQYAVPFPRPPRPTRTKPIYVPHPKGTYAKTVTTEYYCAECAEYWLVDDYYDPNQAEDFALEHETELQHEISYETEQRWVHPDGSIHYDDNDERFVLIREEQRRWARHVEDRG